MKRLFDLSFSIVLFIALIIPMLIVAVAIKITSKGSIIFWSDRVGMNNKIFQMPKFRTMIIETPSLASHLLDDPETYLSPIGGFLRATSLDELPQLISVLKGDMSFVGPRPALFNQDDLIALRNKKGVHRLMPGITGWAQVNGRDELEIPAKVAFDEEYLLRKSFWFDSKIIVLTILKVFKGSNVSH
jgi:O-antigen biosynthesis protein WbqP